MLKFAHHNEPLGQLHFVFTTSCYSEYYQYLTELLSGVLRHINNSTIYSGRILTCILTFDCCLLLSKRFTIKLAWTIQNLILFYLR